MGFGEETGQLFVIAIQPAVRADVGGVDGQPLHAATAEAERIEPDAVAACLNVAAHDAGQEEDDGGLVTAFDLDAAPADHRLGWAVEEDEVLVLAPQGARAGPGRSRRGGNS